MIRKEFRDSYRGSPETDVAVGSKGKCAVQVPVRHTRLPVGTGTQVANVNFYAKFIHYHRFIISANMKA
jgi:hypothetical protein